MRWLWIALVGLALACDESSSEDGGDCRMERNRCADGFYCVPCDGAFECVPDQGRCASGEAPDEMEEEGQTTGPPQDFGAGGRGGQGGQGGQGGEGGEGGEDFTFEGRWTLSYGELTERDCGGDEVALTEVAFEKAGVNDVLLAFDDRYVEIERTAIFDTSAFFAFEVATSRCLFDVRFEVSSTGADSLLGDLVWGGPNCGACDGEAKVFGERD